jgi:hypothetical protein
MHLQHAPARLLRSLTRQSTLTRYLSLLTIPLLVLAWVIAIRNGERRTFEQHIEACAWSSWEDWPAEAAPHRLVFVADPQIVDPHTYPGRPWPLSTLTERYTDRYMRRNFQLINRDLDPDSIVFLGDLFDGGREWSTEKARPLRKGQQKKLDKLKAQSEKKQKQIEEEENARLQAEAEGGASEAEGTKGHQKRSWASYDKERKLKRKMNEDPKSVRLEDHNIDKRGNDLKEFAYGENGRWKSWGMKQWNTEYDRFGNMFFAPEQLYPRTQRRTIAAWDVPAHPLNVLNGASDIVREEHAVIGGKARRLLTSLPGNHDVGFGNGVQLAVRDRFNARFGETNRVDVLGNHSFVSIDAPSLAAYSQFTVSGETYTDTVEERQHIWKPAMNFLNGIKTSAATAVADQMAEYFPEYDYDTSLKHAVEEPDRKSTSKQSSAKSEVNLPVVLLTHVPLYRDPGTDCGVLRERGHAISISGGYQYQNTLTRELSNEVAQKVSNAGDIAHVFSGDDHDYCDVYHRYNVGSIGKNRSPEPTTVRETTVKSFSWAMGVRKPGFQLLSLWNPVDAQGESLSGSLPTVQTHLCLLPDQISILINYGKLAGFTILVLLARAILVAIRGVDANSTSEESDTLSSLSLPHLRNQGSPNGSANGYSTPNKSEFKGRQRASSTGLKSLADNNQHLGVQRSYNARTRSVSPAPGNNYSLPPGGLPNVPMFDSKSGGGLFPQYADDSDEESNVGDVGDHAADSQSKFRRKRRGYSRPRIAFNEFGKSLGIVAGCGAVLYLWRIWSW